MFSKAMVGAISGPVTTWMPGALFEHGHLLHRHSRNEVDLPAPQRRAGRQGILHDTELQRVDVGQPLSEVVGVLFQDHVLRRGPIP